MAQVATFRALPVTVVEPMVFGARGSASDSGLQQGAQIGADWHAEPGAGSDPAAALQWPLLPFAMSRKPRGDRPGTAPAYRLRWSSPRG